MKAAIIGGGITGLTTALALQKVGIRAGVFEKATELNEIGAGLWLQPNAIKVLEWLGIINDVRKNGIELDRAEITNSDLVPFKKMNSEVVQDEYGNKIIAIHRARLQQLLYKAVCKSGEVILGKRYMNHSNREGKIQVEFQDSKEIFDLVLAADGIHSSVRQVLFLESALRSSGQTCWRGVAKLNLPDDLMRSGREAWGGLLRFGFSQIAKDEVYWFAVGKSKNLKKSSNVGTKEYLINLFEGFHGIVSRIISTTNSDEIHMAELSDLVRLDKWHVGSACLLGDAAHATTPNMGQGACQGIEDAFFISQYLQNSENGFSQIFEKFTQSRRKKVDYVVNNSWRFGQMAHSRVGQALAKMMMKITPENVLKAQMDKLYAVADI